MPSKNSGIRIVAIGGSVRPGNFTWKALDLVTDELRKNTDVHLEVVDPAKLHLPLPGTQPAAESTQRLQKSISAASGVILATPEYHGSFSSVMKLVIENLGFPSVLSGKPVALMGVAAGAIGAVKSLEHLRSVCSHIGAIVLPGPVSVAGVQGLFDESGRCTDPAVEKRLRGVGTHLLDYIRKNLCPRVALEQLVRGTPQKV